MTQERVEVGTSLITCSSLEVGALLPHQLGWASKELLQPSSGLA